MEYDGAVWLLMAVCLSRRILKTLSGDKRIFGNIISHARIDLFKQQPYFQHLANRHKITIWTLITITGNTWLPPTSQLAFQSQFAALKKTYCLFGVNPVLRYFADTPAGSRSIRAQMLLFCLLALPHKIELNQNE